MDKVKNQENYVILEDVKRGKSIPWKEKKIKSLKVSDSFKRLKYIKKSNRIKYCGSYLEFIKNIETNEKKLYSANFCKERLCPMCQWRKSLKVFHQVSRIMDKVQKERKNLIPLFLTLTLKNCTGSNLSSTLDNIFQSWYKLVKYRKIKRIVKGWFRTLEITYNKKNDTFHPHIHSIIMVDKNYFKKNNKDYMQTSDWVNIWRKALNINYDPICDIRKIKNNKKKYKAMSEVAKYTLKDTDFIFDDIYLTDKVIGVLNCCLKGRRLYALGGVLKQIAKEIKISNLSEGDLVHIDEEKIREDVSSVIELYHWNFGFTNYVKIDID